MLLGSTDFSTAPLAAVQRTAPAHGQLTLASNGAFLYVPDGGFSGTDTFTFQATDSRLASNIGTVTIDVLPVIAPPVVLPQGYATQEDQRLYVVAPGVLADDTDPQGLPLTAIVATFPRDGTVIVNAAGAFVYTPNPGFTGIDTFSYVASDGRSVSAPATVAIGVTPIGGTTAAVVPATITGSSTTSNVTNNPSPSFTGTTIPNGIVYLYAIPTSVQAGLLSGSPASASPADVAARAALAGLTVVGQTISDSNGVYTVTSRPLFDGAYNYFVEALRTDGLSAGVVFAGMVTIDTVAPKIVDPQLLARAGEVAVTFQDLGSGMDLASLANPANYSFSRQFYVFPKQNVITSAQVLPTAGPSDPVTVILHESAPRIRHGNYLFQVLAAGIRDVAGNALDGALQWDVPDGQRHAGEQLQRGVLHQRHERRPGEADHPDDPGRDRPGDAHHAGPGVPRRDHRPAEHARRPSGPRGGAQEELICHVGAAEAGRVGRGVEMAPGRNTAGSRPTKPARSPDSSAP